MLHSLAATSALTPAGHARPDFHLLLAKKSSFPPKRWLKRFSAKIKRSVRAARACENLRSIRDFSLGPILMLNTNFKSRSVQMCAMMQQMHDFQHM